MRYISLFSGIEAASCAWEKLGWTDIDGAKDAPRYKALGNSIAVPVLEWIGKRIEYVDGLS